MPRARADVPKKAPSQDRSRATVDAILEATAHILRAKGYAGCSTNAVARRAGVSVGSLYQYFPSKEALVVAVGLRFGEQSFAQFMTAAETSSAEALSIDQTIRRCIHAMIAMHRMDPKLHHALTEEFPRIASGRAAIRAISQRAADLVRAWLELHKGQIRQVDPEVATYVLITSVTSVAHMQVLEPPANLTEEQLVDELCELALRYLGVRPPSTLTQRSHPSGE